MTMVSFRLDEADAEQVQAWAQRLGISRSELLRDALRQRLARLAAETDAITWEQEPLDTHEQALSAVADWDPAEDWCDWSDAAG